MSLVKFVLLCSAVCFTATATVGGEPVTLLGSVPHGTFLGLDQVNAGPLPRSLAGRGLVDIIVTVDGVASNAVQIQIK